MNVKSHTRLHAGEGADRAFCDMVLLCDGPRDLFFVVLAGWQVLNRPSAFLYAAQCGFLDEITNLVGMRAEILEQNMIRPKVAISGQLCIRSCADIPGLTGQSLLRAEPNPNERNRSRRVKRLDPSISRSTG